ncbi:hypothetical protein GOP47_0000106 [Adiantum capillus-veneris]|uniref:RNA helicase n=1 Tax=Adiantum capillus-veneris TaxID=13818 RepID=A0A9D4VEH1_ADICA|nr:hypothetical protein GOP47_0000106 [Adiantum capillus-veneris]
MASAKNSQTLARRAILHVRTRSVGVVGAPQIASTDTSSAGPSSSSSIETPNCVFGTRRMLHYHRCQSTRQLNNYNQGLHSWASAQASASPAFAADPFDSEDLSKNASETASNVAGGEGVEIAKLPISPLLINGLAKRGITSLFPIQRAVLEPTLKGHDIIARAKTGTGKTLAFGIPILDRVLKENEKRTRGYGRAPLAVILAPTRELAKQVETELKESAPSAEIVCVYGGVSLDAQVRQVQKGVDIAVGTPGRMIDLLDRGALNLREVQYFVLDEADRMLAVGFEEAVEKILQHLPPQKQSLLFSATVPDWVRKLAGKYLKNHIIVDLVGDNDEKLAEGIKVYSISTTPGTRRFMLSDLITVYGKGRKAIVFTQTKKEADEVSSFLCSKLGCEALHGDISQHQREKTLKSFRDGRLSVLVATDVAARGLDISNVDLVVHYDVANDTETFVHRSGRTGRAGKQGTAILMYMEQQRRTLDSLERELGCKFEGLDPPGLEDVIGSSAHQAINKLKNVSQKTRDIFVSAAEKLYAEEGAGAFAAALACLCGCTELPTARSLISYEHGFMTLQVTRPGGSPIASAEAVTQFVSQAFPSAASSIGKIRMLSDSQVPGAVFDLPENMARSLLSMTIGTGEVLEAPKKLPRIVEDVFRSGGFGGGFGRGFAPRSSPGRFSSGGFSGGGNWSSGSSGGSDWSSRPSYGNNNWSNRSPTGSDNSNWSSRPSFGSGGNSGSGGFGGSGNGTSAGSSLFSGKCLRCGQPGHRISDCPVKWNPPR